MKRARNTNFTHGTKDGGTALIEFVQQSKKWHLSKIPNGGVSHPIDVEDAPEKLALTAHRSDKTVSANLGDWTATREEYAVEEPSLEN